MKMIMTNYWQKRIFCLITSIFILTGYKIFCEEFIIPIKYGYNGKLLSNATHYIHSFTVGDTVFTQYKMKVYQNHYLYEYFVYSEGYKPYRDGTNLIVNVSSGAKLTDIFDMSERRKIYFFETYFFHENYINNPAFRIEIKRLADFLDRSGVVYSVRDYSITFNSILNDNIEAINYLQKMKKYYEESYFIKTIHSYIPYRWKFKVEKKKFRYPLTRGYSSIGNRETGQLFFTEEKLNEFQKFLDKKKINLKLLEHIKVEADNIEAALLSQNISWGTIESYQILTNYFESGKKVKYYILDLKDFIVEVD